MAPCRAHARTRIGDLTLQITQTSWLNSIQVLACTGGSIVGAASAHQADGKTHYLLDGPSVIAEYNGLGVVTEQHNNNPQRIDEQFDLVQGGTKLWPITDALGSVYAWVDRSGTTISSYSYDVYGTRTQTSGSINVAWGYTGREHDADTGLNYNRDRYLAPGLAAWTQADRLEMVNGPNEYAYARSSPSTAADPLGTHIIPTDFRSSLLLFTASQTPIGNAIIASLEFNNASIYVSLGAVPQSQTTYTFGLTVPHGTGGQSCNLRSSTWIDITVETDGFFAAHALSAADQRQDDVLVHELVHATQFVYGRNQVDQLQGTFSEVEPRAVEYLYRGQRGANAFQQSLWLVANSQYFPQPKGVLSVINQAAVDVFSRIKVDASVDPNAFIGDSVIPGFGQ